MELSTAVSDFILSLTSFGTAVSLLPTNSMASFGFLFMSVAAGFGTVRFFSSEPSEHIIQCHGTMSWMASTLGLSLMAGGYYRKFEWRLLAMTHVGFAIAYIILKFTIEINQDIDAMATSAISSTAILSIGICSMIKKNPFGMMGALLYMLSGAVGTRGSFLGIKRIDWFHYLLAFGNVVLMRAYHYDAPVVKPKTS